MITESQTLIFRIPLSQLELNEGQIDGLTRNPRTWTDEELAALKASIIETPKLLEMRGLIVIPDTKRPTKYVVLGGNMRLSALRELKAEDAPCMIMDPYTDIEELKAIVIKDNGSFGNWDTDELGNHFDDLPLPQWGVPGWVCDGAGSAPPADTEDAAPTPPSGLDAEPGETKPFVAKLTFTDERSCQQFVDKYQDILKDEFNCTLSVSGGL